MVEIRILGEQRVAAGGETVPAFRAPRVMALLGYLVLHRGEPQPRHHIAGVFWPDSTEMQARTNLRRELHHLRAGLPDPDACVTTDHVTVTWRSDAPAVVDVAVFEAAVDAADAAAREDDSARFRRSATEAVTAYGGDLMPAFYEDWVLSERERLRRRCLDLIDRLTTALAEDDDLTAAIGYARRRTTLEPYEEAGYRRLMELQVRDDDRSAALNTYHRCATVLERELGVSPSADTVALYRSLFDAAVTAAEPGQPGDVTLVGRAAERAALDRAWVRVTRDGPRLVAIIGEAGVGKTRLAAEAAGTVRRYGGVVLTARCYPSRGRLAFAPVAEWLRSPRLRPHLVRLDTVWRAEVGRLLPELGGAEVLRTPEPGADTWQRRSFLEGMARAALAGEQATLLVLDDLQWCDADTLEWLEVLLHLGSVVPTLVVVTARTEEVGDNAEAVAFLDRARAEGTLDEIDLAPLGAEESAMLAGAVLGEALDAGAVAQLHSSTGGFPLFVLEAVREGSLPTPRTEAVLGARLSRLGPAAEELAGVAAAVGRDFSLDLLATVAGIGDDDLMAAVDELWRRRLLRERTATTYDFSHDLLRDAAYKRLTPPHRRLLHRRIAAAMEKLQPGTLGPESALVAEQYELGGQPERAIGHYAAAAQGATAVFANEEAATHYTRALDLLASQPAGEERDRTELSLRLALTPSLNALRGYSAPELGDSLERAISLGKALREPDAVCSSLIALWGHAYVQGRMEWSKRLAAEVLNRNHDRSRFAGQAHFTLAGSLVTLGRLDEALEHFEEAERLTSTAELLPFGFRARPMVLAWRAHGLWLKGRSTDAAEASSQAVAMAEATGHPFSQALVYAYGSITSYLLGDEEGALALARSGRRLCDRYGYRYYGDWARIMEGAVIGGRPGEALIRTGLEEFGAYRASARIPFYLGLLSAVLVEGGHRDRAADVLTRARSLAAANAELWWLPELWRLAARLEPGEAGEAILCKALDEASRQGSRALELRAAIDLAGRYLAAGRDDEAATLLAPIRKTSSGSNPADLAAADALLTQV